MNRLILISRPKGSGFQPIISGKKTLPPPISKALDTPGASLNKAGKEYF
ncbi:MULTISPECIES: hypothetical protein [unclassified Microcoleus]|nr:MULTISPECIES: hypothetical protein [unclassified Microcoleus]MCC3443702.1 hypothetical protein [Microcoleus sp. PH2017_03_ELD_O_A]MCC3468604.1 hypothetical protein [Microcoleus sp. PH2017_06_SFM_O_A]MCC3507070.1 hypothetical protein [Microcoleus sp. PH2017_19_SFW_U_A]MCC3507859.1 hypothetical protein [Microcoleus sp. PH2017_17_BER_D_A]MCC3414867.1 hypothetical protein [Microcoleus sp. PH2017_02_FOX_O_A]